MKELIFLIEEVVEGGFTATALDEAIFTEGENLSEIKTNIKEAVECHFERDQMPKFIRQHIVKDELMIL